MSDATDLLCAEDVTFGFSGRDVFLRAISVRMRQGECWSIVGPNGAGKSTLLRLLAGLYRPTSGTVRFEGTPLDDMRSIDRACRIAFLPQNPPVDFPLPVEDVVLMGRFPHRSLGMFENAADRRIAEKAMRATQTEPFRARLLNTLSGGEAQRVHLAAALAQQPRALLLDEPTAALDLHHQIGILELLRDLSRREDILVVIVTHDLNLANRYCTHVMLLNEGRCEALGAPEEVLTPAVLEPVYRVAIDVAKTDDGKLQLLTPAVHALGGAPSA